MSVLVLWADNQSETIDVIGFSDSFLHCEIRPRATKFMNALPFAFQSPSKYNPASTELWLITEENSQDSWLQSLDLQEFILKAITDFF